MIGLPLALMDIYKMARQSLRKALRAVWRKMRKVTGNIGRPKGRSNSFYASIRRDSARQLSRGESTHTAHSEVTVLFAQVRSYDVISFDVFDTLLFRSLEKPVDVFSLIADALDIYNFAEIRIEVEQKLRAKKRAEYGVGEITLTEIYQAIEEMTGLLSDVGKTTEFEAEMNLTAANPYMLELFKLLKSAGKRLIAVSDTYFSSEQVSRLLENHGYTGFEKIFVSSEFNCNKGPDGALFQHVLAAVGAENRIFHIGDSQKADIYPARNLGIDTYWYPNVQSEGKPFRVAGMSSVLGSAYRGVVNTHLHNGLAQYSSFYEFGYVYGGIYVFGYCTWLHEMAIKHNADKLLFVLRDGDIYSQVFNRLFADTDNECVFWSRMASLRTNACWEQKRFLQALTGYHGVSIRESLIFFGCSFLIDEASLCFDLDALIEEENQDMLRDFLLKRWDYILREQSFERRRAAEYLQTHIKEAKRLLVVDCGWEGRSFAGIKSIIKEYGHPDIDIFGVFAALLPNEKKESSKYVDIQEMSDRYIPYLYSPESNSEHYLRARKKNIRLLFELFTQTKKAPLLGFEKTEGGRSKPIFGLENTDDDLAIGDIQKGILDFTEDWRTRFSEYPCLFRVSGQNASRPFHVLAEDMDYFKDVLGSLSISEGIGKPEHLRKTVREKLEQSHH
jgi:HAD superfamily hydrolase (TIGR01549 family)